MKVLAFNTSPRKDGNTSNIVRAMLAGAKAAGAEVTEVRIHDIQMKGCMGCLSCRTKPGHCAQKDELTPYLDAIHEADAVIFGTPIYMFRVSGQMKLLVDRMYSLYESKPEGRGYNSMVAPGKSYALVVSQGAADPAQYDRSIRWLAGMTGSGLGMTEVGRIVHTGSHDGPAKENADLLEQARRLGRKLAGAA